MSTLYRLDVRDTSGVLQAQVTDFTSLAYTKTVNTPGILQFGVRGDHDLLTTLADKWQIEVWRKLDGQAWYRDFVGMYRSGNWQFTDKSKFVAYCPGLMSILGWRIVAWKANSVNRSTFVNAKAETIAKTLVTYNATSSATTGNGRLRDGAISGLSVAADSAGGNTLDWNCAFDNLLETLQKLALVAGGDFDLVKTSSAAWQFRWYAGQLGTDRTSEIVFALERGNMSAPNYTDSKIEEKTAAIVGGQGEESARVFAVRTGANYNITTNNIELFVNATNANTTAALNTQGDQKLADVQAKTKFSFKGVRTPSTIYGVHFFLGDLVTAINPFNWTSQTVKVKSVSVSIDSNGAETIEPEFEEVA